MTWYSRWKFKVIRRSDRNNKGWDVLVVTCWHKQQVTARGAKDVIDQWERAAALNPCKFVDCTHPSRWRPDA